MKNQISFSTLATTVIVCSISLLSSTSAMAYDRQLGYIILANGTYDYQFYLNKSWVDVYENGSKTDLDSIGCSGWVGKNSAAGSFVNYNYDCGYGWQVGYIPLYDAKLIEDRRPTTTTTTVPPTTITTTTTYITTPQTIPNTTTNTTATPLKTTTGTTTYTTTPQTIPNTTTNTTTTPLWTTTETTVDTATTTLLTTDTITPQTTVDTATPTLLTTDTTTSQTTVDTAPTTLETTIPTTTSSETINMTTDTPETTTIDIGIECNYFCDEYADDFEW